MSRPDFVVDSNGNARRPDSEPKAAPPYEIPKVHAPPQAPSHVPYDPFSWDLADVICCFLAVIPLFAIYGSIVHIYETAKWSSCKSVEAVVVEDKAYNTSQYSSRQVLVGPGVYRTEQNPPRRGSQHTLVYTFIVNDKEYRGELSEFRPGEFARTPLPTPDDDRLNSIITPEPTIIRKTVLGDPLIERNARNQPVHEVKKVWIQYLPQNPKTNRIYKELNSSGSLGLAFIVLLLSLGVPVLAFIYYPKIQAAGNRRGSISERYGIGRPTK